MIHLENLRRRARKDLYNEVTQKIARLRKLNWRINHRIDSMKRKRPKLIKRSVCVICDPARCKELRRSTWSRGLTCGLELELQSKTKERVTVDSNL